MLAYLEDLAFRPFCAILSGVSSSNGHYHQVEMLHPFLLCLKPKPSRFTREVKMYTRRLPIIAVLSILLLTTNSVRTVLLVAYATPPSQAQDDSGTSLVFIENVGQFPSEVCFYVYGTKHTIWLANDALWVTAIEQGKIVNLKLSFLGANPPSRLEPFNRLETEINYYRDRDPVHWRANVPVWGGVRYVDLYPGIDLEVASEEGQLTWRMVCGPSCQFDPQKIKLRAEGADNLVLESNALRLTTTIGDVTLPLLQAVTADGRPLSLPTTRSEASGSDVTAPFFSSPYSSFLPASISPHDDSAALLASMFVGGADIDAVEAVAVGQDGAVYITGYTGSTGIYWPESPGAYDLTDAIPQGRFTGPIFVAKFNADLSDRAYMTFIGDEYQSYDARITEVGRDIAVDGDGNVYVTGQTLSREKFPVTVGAFDTLLNDGGTGNCPQGWSDLPCPDAFVAKLNASGELEYATYLGGSVLHTPGSQENWGGDDYGRAIAVDQNGHVYVTGRTDSEDFPTTDGAYDRVFSDVDVGLSPDIFVVKLDPAGNGADDLLYGTYVGTGFSNDSYDIAVDEGGIAYATGSTQGAFPVTANAYDTTFGGALYSLDNDAIFFKLNPAGNGADDLLYSTYLGGEGGWFEIGNAIALDGDGNVYLSGSADVPDFPLTPGAFMESLPGNTLQVAFVTKLAPAGDAYTLAYSTFLGGGYDEGHSIAVDSAGHIYVTGETLSPAFPTTPNAFDTTFNSYFDAFVTRLNPSGAGEDDLVYSTYLGSGTPDIGHSIALSETGIVYVAGETATQGFPTTDGAYDTTFGGGTCGSYPCDDGFVSKLDVTRRYFLSGQVVDGDSQPIAGVHIDAGDTYSATTDAGGQYTLTVPADTYTLAPDLGYFWSPVSRTVTVPPDATGQNFVGRNILKDQTPRSSHALGYGEPITYAVHLIYPENRTLLLYDRVPTYTTYISGSLSAPVGVTYDPATDAISGMLTLSATIPTSVSFAVRVEVTGTITTAHTIANRACVRAPGSELGECEWSNRALNFTYVWPVYLPLILR